MVKLKIDGKEVQVQKGATILAAAEKVGVAIPTLCFLKKVSPTGACRICVVEVAGAETPMTACNTVAVEGMEITTQSAQLATIRRQVVELLLVNHPLDCPVCDAGGECDLQNVCYAQDVTRQPFAAEDVNAATIDHWPLIQQVPNRCILCEKCVKVCHEVVGSSALFVNDKGDRAFVDKHLELCEFCGNCVAVCPTGTMISKPFKFKARCWDLTKVRTVCTTCGAQCQVDLNVKQGEVYRVTSEDEGTVNNGNLCVGGYFGHGFINSPKRLTAPLLRENGVGRSAGWDEALASVVAQIARIKSEAGAEAIAALGSPRLTNEENYLFQKLFRAAVGTNNIDSEARFGALRAYKALVATLGLKGASNRLDAIGRAEAVLVFGADPTAEAPAVDWQIELACRKHDGKLVVANLRRVKLSRHANVGLTYKPGSEALLANALARLILDQGLADNDYLQRYVQNLDQLRSQLQAIDLAAAAVATGVSLPLLEEAARHLGQAGSVALVFGADVIRSAKAEEAVAAIANLALVSGALNGARGGLFPLDEKGNMQGLLDMGIAPELLPGGENYASAKGRFEQAWKVTLPAGGRDAMAILEGIEQGKIRFLYVAASNPLVSFPESNRWRKALAKVECLVVQDILASELTDLAHVVLPGTTFAEKGGSVTSLDQRVNPLTAAIKPVGGARPDLQILTDLYRRLAPGLVAADADVLLEEARQLGGLYGAICFTSDKGLSSCVKEPFRPADRSMTCQVATGAVAAPGTMLLAGKVLHHFGTTTTYADGALAVSPAGFVELSAADAKACGVEHGGKVKVTAGSASIVAPVRISDDLPQGLLFAPYHFADLNVQQLIPAGSNLVAVTLAKA